MLVSDSGNGSGGDSEGKDVRKEGRVRFPHKGARNWMRVGGYLKTS